MSLQPTKVLGIYTFTKRVALEEFENKPRKQQGYSTVSHFNIVHYDCHLAAVRYVLPSASAWGPFQGIWDHSTHCATRDGWAGLFITLQSALTLFRSGLCQVQH